MTHNPFSCIRKMVSVKPERRLDGLPNSGVMDRNNYSSRFETLH
jgi:hypothetical protein